jgi:hypothetical protein
MYHNKTNMIHYEYEYKEIKCAILFSLNKNKKYEKYITKNKYITENKYKKLEIIHEDPQELLF